MLHALQREKWEELVEPKANWDKSASEVDRSLIIVLFRLDLSHNCLSSLHSTMFSLLALPRVLVAVYRDIEQ